MQAWSVISWDGKSIRVWVRFLFAFDAGATKIGFGLVVHAWSFVTGIHFQI
jgi:hypothetical protein